MTNTSEPHTAGLESVNVRVFCEEGQEYWPYQNRGLDPSRLIKCIKFLCVRSRSCCLWFLALFIVYTTLTIALLLHVSAGMYQQFRINTFKG